MELTKDQDNAIRSLECAFKKCKDAGVYFHNCYGDLRAYDGAIVEKVDDDKDDMECVEGVSVETIYSLDSWADDCHYVHLKH
jgi:hypothetical protein